MSTRREFLKQASAIAASVGLGPEQLMHADTIATALRTITTGDLAGLAHLISQRQAADALQKKIGGLLGYVTVPGTFRANPGESEKTHAARYLDSLATREAVIDAVADAQGHKDAQRIMLNNLSNGFTGAINTFLEGDSAFAKAVHALSCKLGKLAMDEFRARFPAEKLRLSTVEEMLAKYPNRHLHDDDRAFIAEHHEMSTRFLAMNDGHTTLQAMQEAVTCTYRQLSQQQMEFAEIVDNIFGCENLEYPGKPPLNAALGEQMRQWVDELMAQTDCSTIGAGQKRLITELLKGSQFWTAFTSESWGLFSHAISHSNLEHTLIGEMKKELGFEAQQRMFSLITRNEELIGQFEFRADVLDSLSRHAALPSDYRNELAQQAQAERWRWTPKDAPQEMPQPPQQDDNTPPERTVSTHAPYICTDSAQVYEAICSGAAFARDHSWFERLLDEKNHAKPLDHLKTASR